MQLIWVRVASFLFERVPNCVYVDVCRFKYEVIRAIKNDFSLIRIKSLDKYSHSSLVILSAFS